MYEAKRSKLQSGESKGMNECMKFYGPSTTMVMLGALTSTSMHSGESDQAPIAIGALGVL